MAYTPGPWHVGPNGARIYATGGQTVAVVNRLNDANAPLIAAVPDLLDALNATRRELERIHRQGDAYVNETILNMADVAIAKAK